jgi:hypothetical protein
MQASWSTHISLAMSIPFIESYYGGAIISKPASRHADTPPLSTETLLNPFPIYLAAKLADVCSSVQAQ